MSIICKICRREFKGLITNTHLKTHNITLTEYKEIHGETVSLDFKNHQSRITSGALNPNFGKKMSEDNKQKISTNKKNKPNG